jgi:hypothetical protein
MKTLEQIKAEVKKLSKGDQEALLDWLTNVLEFELELTDDFRAQIQQTEADIAAGNYRIVRPNSVK